MESDPHKQQAFWKRKGFIWTVSILLAGAIFGSFLPDPKSNTTTSTTPAVSQTEQPASSPKVSVGENGYIKVSSSKVILANTKTDLDALTKTYLANDTAGIEEFLVDGKGFAVSNGTKVLVIDTAVGVRKVRVLEGDQINNTGWLPMEYVSKTQ